jgi:glucose/arabinose dehydrogenase
MFLSQPSLPDNRTVPTEVGTIKVETVAKGLNHPWGLAFLPDGTMLVTSTITLLPIDPAAPSTTTIEPSERNPTARNPRHKNRAVATGKKGKASARDAGLFSPV